MSKRSEDAPGRKTYDLEHRTLQFAKQVIELCRRVPQTTINREVIGQLVRASGSIGANYREANESLSKKDFGHRIRITRKEAKETQYYWLQLLGTANPSLNGAIGELEQEALELRKIFSSIAGKTIAKPS
jgi:four helix bundle protein